MGDLKHLLTIQALLGSKKSAKDNQRQFYSRAGNDVEPSRDSEAHQKSIAQSRAESNTLFF